MLGLRIFLALTLPTSVIAQAPVITREPVDYTVLEGCPATFVVEAAGAPPLAFQWYKDGEPIPDATEGTLRIPNVPLAYNGATFFARVSNAQGSIDSRSSTLTVSLDVVPPGVAGARTGNSLQQVIVTFFGGCGSATPMNAAGASDPYNYSFEQDLEIFAAQFIPPNIVVLMTATQTLGAVYTLNVQDVADQAGNVMQPATVSFSASLPVSPSPPFRWAQKIAGGDDDGGYGVASDRTGDFYVATYMRTNTTLGDITLAGAGIFVAVYNESGSVLRAFKASSSSGSCYGLAVDEEANIFVVGQYYGTTSFGSVHLFNDHPSRGRAFIAKYNSTGAVMWARSVHQSTAGVAAAVAADRVGNAFVTGSFGNTSFAAMYDPQGNEVWMETASGTNRAFAVAVDKDSNCTIGGLLSTDSRFGNYMLRTPSGGTAFLARYDTNGAVLWARAEGGDFFWNTVYALAVDLNGNIYATGNYSGSGGFGSPTAPAGADAFVAKYDPSGRRLWVRSGGGRFNDIGFAVTTDPSGSCYVAGMLQGAAAFGPFVLVNSSGDNLEEAFVLKFDTNGELLWAKQAGGPRDDYAYGIALNQNGNCFVAGYFGSPASFDDHTLTTDSLIGDSFVTVIAPEQPRLEITRAAQDIELSWPLWASHFRLEGATTLGLWSPESVMTQITADRVRANISVTGAPRIFRLTTP